MNKAKASETLARTTAEAFELAESHAIAADQDWEAGATIYTFDDNSQLNVSGAEYHALATYRTLSAALSHNAPRRMARSERVELHQPRTETSRPVDGKDFHGGAASRHTYADYQKIVVGFLPSMIDLEELQSMCRGVYGTKQVSVAEERLMIEGYGHEVGPYDCACQLISDRVAAHFAASPWHVVDEDGDMISGHANRGAARTRAAKQEGARVVDNRANCVLATLDAQS